MPQLLAVVIAKTWHISNGFFVFFLLLLLLSFFSNVNFQILSLGGFDGWSNVPQRNVWGNVNTTFKTNKNRPNKHKDPKWSKSRASKVMKIELPDYEFRRKAELEQVKSISKPYGFRHPCVHLYVVIQLIISS